MAGGIPGHRGGTGRPPKAPSQRQGHGAKGALTLIVPGTQQKAVVPKPPNGMLPETRRRWRTYWASAVGSAADPEIDRLRLERYFWLYDEWLRIRPEAMKERFTEGSRGQLMISPKVTYLFQIEERMERAESEFGMTPSARARLGIEIGKARLTADEVSRRLDAGRKAPKDSSPAPSGGDDDWESKWEEA